MPRRAAAPRRAVRLLHQRPSLLRRELHVGARQPHHRASLPAERPPHRLGGTSGPPRGGARHDGEPDGRGGPAPCARRRGHGASVRARPVRRERRRDGGPWNARPRGSLPHGRAHPLLPPGRQPALGHVRMARRRQPPGRRRPARLGRLAHRTLAPPLRRGRLPHHRAVSYTHLVEIILAVHSMLDCPRDRFIFDVGHQAYAHKLVTGRLDEFKSLRRCV